jgi:2-dehydropantoate 2-reductase
VIIAVKAPSLPDIAKRIGPLLGPKTAVVTAMNGVPWWFFLNTKRPLAAHHLKAVDPDGTISQAIPTRRVLGCVLHIAASVDEPGIIRRQLLVGEPDNRPTPRLARLADWLRRADFDSRESPNIQHDIWFKLWGNLSMNPISLLTSATSDRIIDDPLVRRLCVSMMEEAARIGAALGMQASTPVSTSIEKMIGKIRALGSFKMSMLQDMERDNPVELDALLTVTHDIGQLVGAHAIH